ncbi:sulfatase [Dyadobacter tibetensis]|uniref:sulfatase n=1 Tax=Dyadobacter tibetensis TaxID=1211851 RepID=UPI000693B7CD|nr:sulfatase [Dyadobacter tibetensis]
MNNWKPRVSGPEWLRFSAGFLILFSIIISAMAPSSRPNILFICIDDLRPETGAYGNSLIKTPNMDRLAKQGILFTNHFVTQPTCGASRYSLLTGKLPRQNAELKNSAMEALLAGKERSEIPETFIDQLRRKGYYTVGIGKISHSADGYVYGYEEPKSNRLELPHSWDEMLFDPGKWETGWNAFFAYADGSNRQSRKGKVKPYESAPVDDEGYPDGLTANLAVQKLQQLAVRNQPFVLGVGFFKPHLPFNAPQKYWDLYQRDSLPLTPAPNIPQHIHEASLHGSGEFNQYQLGEEKASLDQPVSDAYARKVTHGYYAAVSYVDAQIGKVLDELKRLNLEKETIVVLWGDHGWHLGDGRVWGKHTLFDVSLKSALIMKVPGKSQGLVQNKIVSSIDIYPTLMELCGVNPVAKLDGQSFVGLLGKSGVGGAARVAYSYFNKGISLRTDQYRFTRYFREQTPVIELYDHRVDPHEEKNIAGERPEMVKKLMQEWEKGDTGLFR